MASNKQNGELTILAVGDVHVDRKDPPSIFAHIAPVLREGDIVIGNLEGLNCDRGAPIIGKIEVGSRHLRSAPDNMHALESAGFNAMILANNHNMDYGPEGLLQTIDLLDQKKIAHAGAGHNLDEAHKAAILERNGTTVALLAYTSIFPPAGFAAGDNSTGVATIKVSTSYQAPENCQYQPGFPPLMTTTPDPVEEERMEEDVRQAKQRADIVLVAFHWGVSYGFGKVVGYQRELGRAAIDAGADLIMGAHPHALMAMEMYKGKLICYSMGNFVMDGFTSSHFGAETMILKCQVQNKQITKCTFIPVQISEQWQPRVIGRGNTGKILTKMQTISADFGTRFHEEESGEITISGPDPGTPPARRGLSIEPHRGLPVLVDALLPLPYIVKKLKGIYGKESDA